MSKDLIFKSTCRNWSRNLTSVPPIPAPPPSRLAATIESLKEADGQLKVRPRGKGLTVSKTMVFGSR